MCMPGKRGSPSCRGSRVTVFRPADAAEAVEVVAWAAAEGQPLELVGGGSKRALGRPARAEHELDLRRLAGIVDYDPAELVLTARAATPMAEIEAQLAARGQMLAFEPPDWRGLLGGAGAPSRGEPTLGGTIACNLAGPRRVRAGAARDHLLGFAAVNGWGDAWKSGGRVVKNVTGYDMCKLQAGAYGTLSVLTELSVRVLPRPETACTVVMRNLSDADAVRVMADGLNTPHEVSAAAHLPRAAARRAGFDGAATLLRLEGPAPSVAFRAAALGGDERLDAVETARVWRLAGEVAPLLDMAGRVVWRICPTPSSSPAVLGGVAARCPSAEGFYDWGGGLLWLALDRAEAGADAGAAAVRGAVRAAGGHATLAAAPDKLRAAVPVFEPATGAAGALARRVKESFDPRGILNPGRMHEDH